MSWLVGFAACAFSERDIATATPAEEPRARNDRRVRLILPPVTLRHGACSFRGASYGSGQCRAGPTACQSKAGRLAKRRDKRRMCEEPARYTVVSSNSATFTRIDDRKSHDRVCVACFTTGKPEGP